MKKQLLCLITSLAFTAAFAQHIAPVRTLTIPYASGVVNIDGYADESFYSPEQNTVAFNATGSTGADADYTMSFKVAFDQSYLYLCATILDDYDNSWDWGLTNQWTYDNVEVFFDLDTNGSGTFAAYDTNTIQIRFNRGIDSVNDYGRAANRAAYLYAWENTADGWVFEASIPWSFVLGPGQLPEDIYQYSCVPNGFDVSGVDSDTDGPDAHNCQTAWDQDGEPGDAIEDNAWNNRTVFGIVELQLIGCNELHNKKSQPTSYFPNPVADILHFDNLKDEFDVSIIDFIGNVVITVDIINNQVDLSMLANGVYFVRVGQNVVKIIKQ